MQMGTHRIATCRLLAALLGVHLFKVGKDVLVQTLGEDEHTVGRDEAIARQRLVRRRNNLV